MRRGWHEWAQKMRNKANKNANRENDPSEQPTCLQCVYIKHLTILHLVDWWAWFATKFLKYASIQSQSCFALRSFEPNHIVAYRCCIANCFNLLHDTKSNENVYSWHCIDAVHQHSHPFVHSHQSHKETEEIVSTCEHNAPIEIDAKTYRRKIHLTNIIFNQLLLRSIVNNALALLCAAVSKDRFFLYFSLTNVHRFKYV